MSSVMLIICEGGSDIKVMAEVSLLLKQNKFENDSYFDSYHKAIKFSNYITFQKKRRTKIDRILNKILHNLLDVDAPPFPSISLIIGTS